MLKIRLRKKRLLLMMIVVGLFLTGTVFAQERLIKGVVTDFETEEPLPGVNVVLKGTREGTVTAVDGTYSIVVPGNAAVLSFSFIGFTTEEVLVGNSTTIDVPLILSMESLTEVVVIGYGNQDRRDITGAVGIIKEEVFDARLNTQLGSLIQGKAAGIQVISSSAKPSAGLNLRIRGTSSITAGSEPLYVVDGVITSDTRTINPADIESISVLKDASSAAIYGAQGGNGVVLITTKKGDTEKPEVVFNTYMGISRVRKMLPLLNGIEYKDLQTEMGKAPEVLDQFNANSNWQDEVFRDAMSRNYQLAVSGKNENTTYYLSGGWMRQEGIVRTSTMDRANFRINLDQKINEQVKVGTNLTFNRYHDVDVADNLHAGQGGVIDAMLATPPIIGIYNPDGTFTSNPFQFWENPLAFTDGSTRNYNSKGLMGNIYGEADLLPGLSFRSSLGFDYGSGSYDQFLDPYLTGYGRSVQGLGVKMTNLNEYWSLDNTLSYNKSIGDHSFSAMMGTVYQGFNWETSTATKTGFANSVVQTLNGGSTPQTVTSFKDGKVNTSFISRLTYDYAGKYLLLANFRADGSSSFGSGKRWGYFPSFSAGWRVSEEGFLQGASFINDLKLRAGWGSIGNDRIGNAAYLGKVSPGSNYPIGKQVQSGTAAVSIENTLLQWETTEQTNIGFDLAVMRSRILLTADAYLKNTSGALLYIPLPFSTGFAGGLANMGELQNKGIELQLTSHNMVNALKWETDFNISFNREKVINLEGQEIYHGMIPNRDNVSYATEGQPMGLFYGYVAAGVDPATGMMQYMNAKGEKTINPSPDDRTIIGNANPDFLYGITNTLSYHGIGLSIFLQGSQGNEIFNGNRLELESMESTRNQSSAVVDRWKKEGDLTTIPRAVPGDANNSRISSRFVEDGSYMRVKTFTLSYELPASVLSKVRINSLRLYVTAENMLTFTKYSGFDPEVNALPLDNAFNTVIMDNRNNYVRGVDYGTFPHSRNLIVGLNMKF